MWFKKYFLAFPYHNLTVPHLKMLTPSFPESSLLLLVSVSMTSAQASKSKLHIKNTSTSAQYLASHIVESNGWKVWYYLTTLTPFKPRHHFWSDFKKLISNNDFQLVGNIVHLIYTALWWTNRNSCFHKLYRPSKCVNFNVGYLHT